MSRDYRYWKCCVDFWDIEALCTMIYDSIEITRATFLKHVDRQDLEDLEASLGYFRHPRQGLTCAGDYHVRYHRSVYKGRRVYYMRQSAIEYIFRNEES